MLWKLGKSQCDRGQLCLFRSASPLSRPSPPLPFVFVRLPRVFLPSPIRLLFLPPLGHSNIFREKRRTKESERVSGVKKYIKSIRDWIREDNRSEVILHPRWTPWNRIFFFFFSNLLDTFELDFSSWKVKFFD